MILYILYEITHNTDFKQEKQILFPKHLDILKYLGENIKLARLGRQLTQQQLSQRADVIRSKIYLIELGVPSVAVGAYFNILRVLMLQEDFF